MALPPHQAAGLVIGRVFLPHMHPVAAEFGSQIRPVVEDEGHIMFLGDRQKCCRCPSNGAVICRVCAGSFEAQLQACHITCCQRSFKHLREVVEMRAVQIGWADEVQAAARSLRCAFGRVCDQNLP